MALATAIISAIATLGSAAIGANSGTKSKTTTGVAAAGGQDTPAANVFTQNVPTKATPPQKPVQAPGPDVGTVLAAAADPNKAPTSKPIPTKDEGGLKDVLKSLPGALADVAPLLALFQPGQAQNHYGIIGGQGGPQGQLVQGMNLPKRPTIGELLQALPRARYG